MCMLVLFLKGFSKGSLYSLWGVCSPAGSAVPQLWLGRGFQPPPTPTRLGGAGCSVLTFPTQLWPLLCLGGAGLVPPVAGTRALDPVAPVIGECRLTFLTCCGAHFYWNS